MTWTLSTSVYHFSFIRHIYSNKLWYRAMYYWEWLSFWLFGYKVNKSLYIVLRFCFYSNIIHPPLISALLWFLSHSYTLHLGSYMHHHWGAKSSGAAMKVKDGKACGAAERVSGNSGQFLDHLYSDIHFCSYFWNLISQTVMFLAGIY